MGLRLGMGTVVAAACAAAAWALLASPARAQPGGIKLKLVSGGLTVSAPAVSALAGRSVRVVVRVTDARGTGAGWSLKLASIPGVFVSRVAASCASDSTCTLPSASGIGTSPLVLRAAPNSGMGVMQLTVTLAPLTTGASAPVRFSISN